METKINIAEILKDKPEDTKLYSPLFGDVYLLGVECGIIRVEYHRENGGIPYSLFFGDGRYYNYPESEPLLFPSKEMHDWSKFTWKKGDVLVSKGRRTLHVIFEGFNDDTYTTFKGKHFICDYSNKENCNDEEYYNDYHKEVEEQTIEFEKDNVNNAQIYINIIERKLGGKLNRETLEIEKQPEFKDGDILCVIDSSDNYTYILIYKSQDDKCIYCYVTMFLGDNLNLREDGFLKKPKDYFVRYTTISEKQRLFNALAKKGKAWDAEKKQIVDLKPEVKFKPFDKVVACCESTHKWACDMFSHYSKDYKGREVIIGFGGLTYYKALPYNEKTAKLLGTTDDVED